MYQNPNRPTPLKALLLACVLATQCGLFKKIGSKASNLMDKTTRKVDRLVSQNDSVLVGRLLNAREEKVAVVAMLKTKKGYQLDDFVFTEKKRYILYLQAGAHTVFAFADGNANGKVDEGENLSKSLNLITKRGRIHTEVNLNMASTGKLGEEQTALRVAHPRKHVERKQPSEDNGSVVDLNERRFSARAASGGYMNPSKLMRQVGANILFTKPYNSKKTPILFVHGAKGTAVEFGYLARTLNQDRFQFWYFYYPSGYRLDSLAEVMADRLEKLRKKYALTKLHLVAHSMGGLISRAFLVGAYASQQQQYIKTFVSISTPWAGNEFAQQAEKSPRVVPNWFDIASGSDFLLRIFTKKLGPGLNTYLLFGYGGSSLFNKEANDGTVSLKSQLFPKAQAEARRVIGFNADHKNILNSQEVSVKLNELLETSD